jgi:Cdc6-like AAA superfamily ATPase
LDGIHLEHVATMRSYVYSDFEYKHERIFFRELVRRLDFVFGNDETAIIIGNPTIGNVNPDALFMRNGQITVIEFKNYGGELEYDPDGVWYLIKGGEDILIDYSERDGNISNPQKQVERYRNHLITQFSKPFGYPGAPNFRKMTAMVLFHERIEFDRNEIKYPDKSFFHIDDIHTVVDTLQDIYDKQIVLNGYQRGQIERLLHVDQLKPFTHTTEIPDEIPQNAVEQVAAVEESILPYEVDWTPDEINNFKRYFLLASDLVHAEINAAAMSKPTEQAREQTRSKNKEIHAGILHELGFLASPDGVNQFGMLGHLLGPHPQLGKLRESSTDKQLIHITPLTDSQRNAVTSAFERRMTVVTGPPGTGKTQIVINIVANALARDENVVVASKTNRAVDVIKAKWDAAIGYSFGIRIGSDAYQESNDSTMRRLINRKINQLAKVTDEPIDTLRKALANRDPNDAIQDGKEFVMALIDRIVYRMDSDLAHQYVQHLHSGIQNEIIADGEVEQLRWAYLEQHKLVFTTTLSASMGLPLQPESIDLLIVDEASQCDLVSMMPLLVRANRVVILGDPLQLRHISLIDGNVENQIAAKHVLESIGYHNRSFYDAAYERLRELKDYSVIFLVRSFQVSSLTSWNSPTSISTFQSTEPDFGRWTEWYRWLVDGFGMM